MRSLRHFRDYNSSFALFEVAFISALFSEYCTTPTSSSSIYIYCSSRRCSLPVLLRPAWSGMYHQRCARSQQINQRLEVSHHGPRPTAYSQPRGAEVRLEDHGGMLRSHQQVVEHSPPQQSQSMSTSNPQHQEKSTSTTT